MLNFKKITSMILAVSACAALFITAFAEDEIVPAKMTEMAVTTTAADATNHNLPEIKQDEDGNYYFEDENGNKILITFADKVTLKENGDKSATVEIKDMAEPRNDADANS